ncbi:putative protein phosphatase 2C-type [Posidoniimonas polymericola]|uniref:PPM-type phosphatase domain-containing protein n=1 Tax=Posidoniimonas polymericola TaxID=2528002 RepID=A0A5C5YSJ6_9BACT|nr:PP2C family serine/threonine-protein phosphatase [Posidoniimonas polymericola]TWT77771.1 putative protein phosphatase 2C-type [Posidoniimonas polymericola]
MPNPSCTNYRIEYAVKSDVGMRRANNQDAVLALADTDQTEGRGSLFIVADGMGAHAAGELASELAVKNVPHEYKMLRDQPAPAALRQAVQKANGLIHAKGQSSSEFQGMGTTCASLVVLGDAALIAHVGDSRVYRIRELELEQLTFDHSLVWELAEASHTTEDKIPACIPKNVITRSLGPHPVVNVDLEGPFDLKPGDVYLLCSDGLTGVVGDELIGGVLTAMAPEEAAQTLVDLANLRGGPDNISVIVVRVGESDQPAGDDDPEQPTAHACRGAAAYRTDPVRWLAMAATAVCLAVVIWCIREQQTWGAVAAAIGLGGAAVRALGRSGHPRQAASFETLGGPYGSAPYRNCDCHSGERITQHLRDVVDELSRIRSGDSPRTKSTNGAEKIDWSSFDARCEQAAGCGDWRETVSHYGAAIRNLMSQVRETPEAANAAIGAPSRNSAIG